MSWRQSTAAATWVSRTSFGHAVHSNKMWLVGGYGNNYPTAPVAKRDVWYSTDGFTWSLATAAAAWSARSGQRCVSFGGKLWMVSGDGSSREIWNSTDGITWTLVTAAPAFTARLGFLLLTMSSKLWVIGGFDSTGFLRNDVWSSSDGITWTQVLPTTAIFSGRRDMAGCVMGGRMWVMGGRADDLNGINRRDVWSSADGADWTQHNSAAPWSDRQQHKACASASEIFVTGGITENSGYSNEGWVSSDGAYWQQMEHVPSFSPARASHGCEFFLNKPWVYGGISAETAIYLRDAWYYETAGIVSQIRWSVLKDSVSVVSQIRWTFLANVGKSSRIRWGDGGSVGITSKIRWNQPGQVSVVSRARWKVNPQTVGISSRMRWGVSTSAGVTSAVRWAIGLDCNEFEFTVTGTIGVRSKSATGILEICTE